jgi:hypothetical protein
MNGFGSSLCSSRKRSGPKHRCCNVHNELAYDDTAQGPLSQPPVPSPGGQPSHPQSCSDEPYEQWGHAEFACSDLRNVSPERQTLCKTDSFLASAHPCFAIARSSEYVPTADQRGLVESAAVVGLTQADIAEQLGIDERLNLPSLARAYLS